LIAATSAFFYYILIQRWWLKKPYFAPILWVRAGLNKEFYPRNEQETVALAHFAMQTLTNSARVCNDSWQNEQAFKDQIATLKAQYEQLAHSAHPTSQEELRKFRAETRKLERSIFFAEGQLQM